MDWALPTEFLEQLVIEFADRVSRDGVEIRGIEEELESLASRLERVQLPEEQLTRIRNVTARAEDLIDNFATIASQDATTVNYRTVVNWFKLGRAAEKLIVIRERIRLATATAGLLEEEPLPERGNNQTHIPRYLWRFIYHFLLFPANFQVPARRLIVLWVAEGIIHPNNANESAEYIAERYLNVLINLEIVLVKKKKLNGRVQTCSLKSDIRDAWLVKAREANFFERRTKHIRRLIDHSSTGDASFIRIHGNPSISDIVPSIGDLVSFLSFDTQEGSKPGEDIGNFLDKCILSRRLLWLSVLDLERVFRPKLPKTLGKLIRLKYLGLRWTYLERLPDSVYKLLQIQVLDVKHTYITILPSSIWRMQDLRHLYLSEAFCTRFPDRPSGVVSLTNLQTLWGAFIGEDNCVTDGLDTLLSIRKLALSCGPRSSFGDSDMSGQLKAVDKWISKLRHLERLRLKSRDKQGRAADLNLTTLEENTNLSTVYLLGKLNPHVVDKFPHRLTDITLSGSGLDMDPMEFLGRLPNLQILRLLAKSVSHRKLHCSGTGFPLLKVVHIWCLENLEEWVVEEGSLPCLEEFEIRSCQKLEKLPDQLQCINTLNKFWLTNMPEGFMQELAITHPRLWPKIQQQKF